jgi:peptidoglycan/LPS O-acetylase OafA/YrhL
MTGEGRRRVVFAVLLAIAILGAVALMASAMLDGTWRMTLQFGGLAVCAGASLAVVLIVRHWSTDDGFWWPDSDR